LVELIAVLKEEQRLRVEDGRAAVVGQALPRRLTDSMRDRLDRLSGDAAQAIRVASVLSPRFSAGQLAAMLQRRPSAIVAAVDEGMRRDFLIEAGDRLGFRHRPPVSTLGFGCSAGRLAVKRCALCPAGSLR